MYDLFIQSQLLLPNVQIAVSRAFETKIVDQVSIVFGEISLDGLSNPSIKGACYQISTTDFWLNVPSVARFLVTNGQQIVIDPNLGVDEDSIRAFLFNVCFEVLLKQRQHLVIPGYALKLGASGAAFLGAPGPGYYMLLGEFVKRRYSVLGGNFFALTVAGNILPGMAQIELWPHIAYQLGFDLHALKQIRPEVTKCIIPLEQDFSDAVPLDYIYILRTHKQNELFISSIDGPQKIDYLRSYMKENRLTELRGDDNSLEHFIKIVNQAELICLNLPSTGLKLRNLADSIENDLAERRRNHVSA